MKKAGLIFLLMIIILTGVIRLSYLLGPVDRYNGEEILVQIKRGSSTRQIANILRQEELIFSPELFVLLSNFKNQSGNLQAGYYRLKQSHSLLQILDIISRGDVATIRVTIPEGFTVERIAALLAEKTRYEREEFLDLMRKGNEFNYDFLPAPDGDYKYRLEGYLYPDTYQVPEGYRPHEIIEMILNQFEEKWNDRLQKEELLIHEIITIASLVESEGRLDREKPLIAGVIFNRLEEDMLLQIDAGVQYALPERKERILYSDLEVNSPYNTYRYRGLPPGPVCSPGEVAIEAVLEPAEVEFLFYFALPDGSHIFSKSYQEHLELQQQILDSQEEKLDEERD